MTIHIDEHSLRIFGIVISCFACLTAWINFFLQKEFTSTTKFWLCLAVFNTVALWGNLHA